MTDAEKIAILRAALETLCGEYRARDLPHGSAAYHQATDALAKTHN